MSLPIFHRGDGIFQSAAPEILANQKNPDHGENLIYFLSVLQHFQVDVLPITWQPALDGLGQGASAIVEQSLINAQLSFAFKRTSRGATYKVLVSEVAILSYPRIKDHPNVNRLQGICWEIGKPEIGTPTKVWPVLVSAKAPFGDLRNFLRSDIGRNLSLDARLDICKDIARAIETLHSCNVVHGDLKPENILIFEGTESQKVIAKVSDFGYSSIWVNIDDAIRLPATKPWSAPEYHPRAFKLRDAKKLDLYTYGLVCLWIFAQSSEPGEIQRQLATKLFNQDLEWNVPVLEKLKRDGLLADLVSETFDASGFDNSEALSRFYSILTKCLSHEVKGRMHSMLSILDILTDANLEPWTTNFTSDDLRLPKHVQLDLTDCFLLRQLAASEIEVRLYVTDQMHAVSQKKRNYCQECLKSAAFQSAIQCSLGFGVPLDIDRARHWLSLTHRSQEELMLETLRIKSATSPIHPYRPGLFNDLVEQGFVGTSETNPELRCSYGIEIKSFLNQRLRQEICDIRSSLGELHAVSFTLNIEFSKVLNQDGLYEEVSEIRYDLLERVVESRGENHPEVLPLMNGTALALVESGRLSEATELSQRALPLYVQMYGEDHLLTVRAMEDLSFCLSKGGHYDKAQELSNRYIRILENLMGETHPTTCAALHNRAFHLVQNGFLEDAESLARLAISRCTKAFGDQDQWTIRAKGGLAHILMKDCQHGQIHFKDKSMLIEAERLRSDAVKYFETTRGSSHPETLTAIAELAVVYLLQQRVEKAQMIVEKALGLAPERLAMDMSVIGLLEIRSQALAARELFRESAEVENQVFEKVKKVKGETHPDTIVVMENLAHSYRELNDLTRSEDLTKSVLQYKTERYGVEQKTTIITRQILADLYERQSRWPEAEQEYRTVLHLSQKTLKPLHPLITFTRSRIARLLQRRGEWDEAMSLNQQVLEERKQTKPPGHQTIFDTLKNMAEILNAQDRQADAATIYIDIRAQSQEHLGPSDVQNLKAVQNLAAFYAQQEHWPKARRFFEEEIQWWETYKSGADDEENLLLAQANLAITCGSCGDWPTAVDLWREVREGKRRTVGPEHGDSLQAEEYLKRAEAELLRSATEQ